MERNDLAVMSGAAQCTTISDLIAPCFAGLLLASITDPDPVVFFEAKMLYRTVVEDVPTGSYTIPLGQARIARSGGDMTLVGWGQQVAVLERAVSSYYCPTPADPPCYSHTFGTPVWWDRIRPSSKYCSLEIFVSLPPIYCKSNVF